MSPHTQDSIVRFEAAPLRAIIERVGLKPLKETGSKPHVKAAYRIAVYYVDGRARNSVATLWYRVGEPYQLDVVYEGLFNHKPIVHTVSENNYDSFVQVMSRARFDKLTDQDNLSLTDHTHWFIERVAGGFYKSLLLSPHRPIQPYTWIVNAVDSYLPDAIRKAAR